MDEFEFLEANVIFIREVYNNMQEYINKASDNKDYTYSDYEKNQLIIANQKVILYLVSIPSSIKKDFELNFDKILNNCGRLIRSNESHIIWSVRIEYIKKIDEIKDVLNLIEQNLVIRNSDFSSNNIKTIPSKRKSNSVWTVKKK